MGGGGATIPTSQRGGGGGYVSTDGLPDVINVWSLRLITVLVFTFYRFEWNGFITAKEALKTEQ